MSASGFDLARVLHPVELNHFFSDYWEQRPLIIARGQPDYYADLCSLRDVDYIISSGDVRHPAIRLVKNGSEIPLRNYATNVPWGNDVFTGVADGTKVLGEFRRGATIVLQAAHRTWKPLALFCRNLEAYFTYPLQTNVYLTPPSAQGFAPHYDTHDVLVLQIAGSKHWRIYGSPLPLPDRSLPSGSVKVNIGEPVHELDLSPGDLIYLPRGYIHEALTSESESLHITVGIPPVTWIDVFTEALALCHQDVRFRQAIPVGFAARAAMGDTAQDQFDTLFSVFKERTNLDAVMARLAERFITSRPAMLEGQLLELVAADRLEVDTIVQKRPGIIYRLAADDHSVSLLFPGQKITFPKYGEPLLQFISETSSFKISSLPGDIEIAEKMGFVRRLIREGFLTPVQETS